FFSDSAQNVWVDNLGLHLRITNVNRRWYSAEVVCLDSLGFGTYTWQLASAVGTLDPNVVLGLFTWDDATAYNHRELDIEFARWGNASDPTNAQYVVQPYSTAGNLVRFTEPADAPTTHSFQWQSASVNFSSTDNPTGLPIYQK